MTVHVNLNDLLIIKEAIAKCGGHDRFRAAALAYTRVFGNKKKVVAQKTKRAKKRKAAAK